MKKKLAIAALLMVLGTCAFAANSLSDELQWLAVQIACIGQYSSTQAGNYALGDPQDYYQPRHISKYLAVMSGAETKTDTFYGICFNYAQAAYDDISKYRSHYEGLGMSKGGWYIAAVKDNSRQVILYDPVSQEKATERLNGVYLKENSRRGVKAHGSATWHAWLWVFANDGTIYWIDPTWTDNSGYVWWGVVRDGEEQQLYPTKDLCMITVPGAAAFVAFNNGNANKNSKNYEQAIADYTAVLRSDPNYAMSYYNRGNAYKDKGDYDKAIADYTQAIRLDPSYTNAYNNRGVAYGEKGDYDRAIADFTQAIRLDPNFAKAYYNRGLMYKKRGDYDWAIADYTQAIRLDPNYADAYSNRGSAYANKGDYDRAIADFTQAIRLDPNDAKAYYNRGTAYVYKRDYDRAIADCTQAIRLDPNYADAYNHRGVAYAEKKDYDRAIADYTQAIRLDPNQASAYSNRGNAYANKGDYDRAIAEYEAALRINPNHTDARNNLRIVREERGY